MSVRALTGLAPEWYTPDDQKDDERPTRYKIKPLDGLQFLEVAANGEIAPDGSFTPNHAGRLLLLRYGIKDWENVDDAAKDGKPLKFNLARIKFLPVPHLVELSNVLLERSALGAQDQKN